MPPKATTRKPRKRAKPGPTARRIETGGSKGFSRQGKRTRVPSKTKRNMIRRPSISIRNRQRKISAKDRALGETHERRLLRTHTVPVTWNDIRSKRASRNNMISVHANQGKYQTHLKMGRVKSVDPFKMFHKSYDAHELTTGKARRVHHGGLGNLSTVIKARANELSTYVRSAGGSHVNHVPTKDGQRNIVM